VAPTHGVSLLLGMDMAVTVRPPMIDVALRPAEARAADVAIVIDVLRATSTVTQALASGYERVLCAGSVERAQTLRSAGRVLAGERSCVRPEGFDQGNSPSEALAPTGRELVLATTNGTPAVSAAAEHAGTVLLACLLNLEAAVEAVLQRIAAGALDVQIVCAGSNGASSLEDAYVAGRISRRLSGARTDAAVIAEGVARAFPTPLEALGAGTAARALEAAGLGSDIAFCAQESVLDVVPTVTGVQAGTATVSVAISGRSRARRAIPALEPHHARIR
jgi:2-phosphosulfolactate phosphatase